jgi:sigma-B regulation protein RsbU (phosphoserine phosphatase)
MNLYEKRKIIKKFLSDIRPDQAGDIHMKLLEIQDFIDGEYGRYLYRLFLKEWEIVQANELLIKFEEEHSDSLVLLIQNEDQRMQLKDLNDRLNDLIVMHQKDMLMAANVQRNLFISSPPAVSNCDVSYHYQPCASVSGDFFDFYTNREMNILEGVALADVSGHGIASSLITVLAKPIFFREFANNPDMPINSLLDRINRKLILQMEASENYLTGVLLRIDGYRVEYTNSAHPDIIHFDSEKKISSRVRPHDSDIQGSVMGLSIAALPFKAYTFDVKKGDILVLYTDCFTESQNSDGVEYGEESVMKSLNSCGCLSAEMTREHLVNEFYSFAGMETFKDDLSILVIKFN